MSTPKSETNDIFPLAAAVVYILDQNSPFCGGNIEIKQYVLYTAFVYTDFLSNLKVCSPEKKNSNLIQGISTVYYRTLLGNMSCSGYLFFFYICEIRSRVALYLIKTDGNLSILHCFVLYS